LVNILNLGFSFFSGSNPLTRKFNVYFMLNIQSHLNELKLRFIYIFVSFFSTFFFSYLYVDILMYLLALPFIRYKSKGFNIFETDFIFTSIFEAFYSYITISFIVSFYIMLPLFIYTILGFIQVGLFLYEKHLLSTLISNILILSVLAIFFIYSIFLPLTFKFFLNFEELIKTPLFTLKLEQKITDYVYLTLSIYVLVILGFQFPLIIYYLLKYECISFFYIKKKRRFFIITFFLLGCLLSTPDLYSLLLITIPLLILFEINFFFFQIKESYKKFLRF
jgi:sec-independent protein translocase protein TatC